jgi:hypothetical protein
MKHSLIIKCWVTTHRRLLIKFTDSCASNPTYKSTTETANLPVEENLGKLLQGRVGQVHFQPSNLSERTGEAFIS